MEKGKGKGKRLHLDSQFILPARKFESRFEGVMRTTFSRSGAMYVSSHFPNGRPFGTEV